MSLAQGTRLGLYEILAPLGAGGVGEVYPARDTRLGCEVAIMEVATRRVSFAGCTANPDEPWTAR